MQIATLIRSINRGMTRRFPALKPRHPDFGDGGGIRARHQLHEPALPDRTTLEKCRPDDTGSEAGDGHTAARDFGGKRGGERVHICFRCVIGGHVRSGDVAGDRTHVEDAAASSRHHAWKKSQRQFGQRANIDIDKVQLLAGGSLGRRPEHAETGAIDQHVAVEAAVGQARLDPVGGAGVEEVDGQAAACAPAAASSADERHRAPAASGPAAAENIDHAPRVARCPARFPDEAPVTTMAGLNVPLVSITVSTS